MKKILLPVITAILAAALSFAVSGCQKEYTAPCASEESVSEAAVDLGDVAKNAVENISAAQGNIADAIVEIAGSLAGRYGLSDESQEEMELSFRKIFTNDRWDDAFDFREFLGSFSRGEKAGKNGLSCYEDGTFKFQTISGYYIKIVFGSDFTYTVEIGKGGVRFAQSVIDVQKDRSSLTIYDINDNEKAFAGTNRTFGFRSHSFEVWYDNAEKREESAVVGTNVSVTSPDEVIIILSQIRETYICSEDEALETVEMFNRNVKAYDNECTAPTTEVYSEALYYPGLDAPAILEGKPLCASYFKNQETGLCRVCIMHGDKIVTASSVKDFIETCLEGYRKRIETIENIDVLSKAEIEEIFSTQKEVLIERAQTAGLDEAQIAALEEKISAIEKIVAARTAESESETGVSIASIEMTYTSKGADGNPMTLSGKIYVPCKGSKEFLPVKDVVVNLFGTTTQGDGAFSSIVPLLYTYKYLACDSLAVFEPEYIGFGASADYLQTYLCQHLIAENCSDMVVAGLKLLHEDYDIEFKDGWGTYITGYSQGGGNSMALTRYLTVDATAATKDIVRLKKSYCGAGPYSPALTFDTWRSRGKMMMSLILPMVLYAMNEVHSDIFEGENMKDYFYSEYWESGIPLKVKNVQYAYNDSYVYDNEKKEEGDNTGLLGPEVRLKYITAEEVLDENSDKYGKLKEALTREIVCDDWTPEKPLIMFSDENDNVVPYENTQYAYSVLSAKAPEYVTLQTCNTGDHVIAMLQYNSMICNLFFGDTE